MPCCALKNIHISTFVCCRAKDVGRRMRTMVTHEKTAQRLTQGRCKHSTAKNVQAQPLSLLGREAEGPHSFTVLDYVESRRRKLQSRRCRKRSSHCPPSASFMLWVQLGEELLGRALHRAPRVHRRLQEKKRLLLSHDGVFQLGTLYFATNDRGRCRCW